ncbi:unnamed protein product [Angiostrongylus costaricensis]|uniref:Uncharacterized protein n=1 Tax=Angiostrongylus costaricensis TaxID=334426 RepID=A0A158PM83_ANGCS|nr:unnamed protein product [Angiostrongylus costaricensis]
MNILNFIEYLSTTQIFLIVFMMWKSLYSVTHSHEHAYQDGKTLRLPLNETATMELLDRWLSQAVSGLISAVLDSDEIDDLHQCTKRARTVPEHARCVVKILDVTKPIKRRKTISDDVRFQIVNRSSYTLRSHDDTPILSKVIRQMTKTVRTLKNKKGYESWRSTLHRIRAIGATARMQKEKRAQLKKKLNKMIANTPEKFMDPRKPLAVKKMEMEDLAMSLKKKLAARKRSEMRVPMKLLRDSVKLFLAATGKNVTKFDKKTVKLASPRLLSVVPEQNDDDLFNVLSPSLFSLHEDGDEAEKSMSLPRLLKQLPNSDYEAWLDFIMEASGVTETVDRTEKQLKGEINEHDMRGKDGVPLHLNKKNVSELFGSMEEQKIETFEKLDKTYTLDQKDDLERQGFAFLTPKQLDIVYGPNSPYHKPDSLRQFKKIHRLRDDPHHLIEKDIRKIAEAKKFQVRQKDIVLSPFLFTWLVFASGPLSQPITLSPLLFSPIVLSPAVLGPITLSPWVFIPLILSPRVLSPLILTPLIFSPIILSPLVLHPLILVPGIFNPIVLSPLVLSPFILSPQVFSPLILSPMVLNPLILTPVAGTPLVLNPFLLSPLILSPLFLSSVVLSPYVLSPLIESKLIASEVILSPSWLS